MKTGKERKTKQKPCGLFNTSKVLRSMWEDMAKVLLEPYSLFARKRSSLILDGKKYSVSKNEKRKFARYGINPIRHGYSVGIPTIYGSGSVEE